MDLSKEYVLMCEKAVEIQRIPIRRDFINWDFDTRFYYSDSDRIFYCAEYSRPNKDKDVWLPRQDQLQEMVKSELDVYCGALLEKFYRWYDKVMASFNTFEKCWLAFVMKEKFNKEWNGEDWILIK